LSEPSYRTKREGILLRDDFKCQGCNFFSKKFHEVHHKDDNHSNDKDENLVTFCCLCHGCFHLGFVGQQSKAQIIYLPELEQHELNTILRSMWIAVENKTKYKDHAKLVLAILKNRATHAREILKTSEPRVLANLLAELPDKDYKRRSSFLADFKLLHSPELYERQLKYWSSETINNYPEENWGDLLQEAQK